MSKAPQMSRILGCKNIARLMEYALVAKWSETSGHAGIYWCEYQGVKFFVKLALYDHLEYDGRRDIVPAQGLVHPVDAEIDIMRAIKTCIIDRGYTPHLAEILAAYRCPEVHKLIEDRVRCTRQVMVQEELDDMPPTILCLYSEMVARGVARDQVAVIISEQYDASLPDLLTHFLPIDPAARQEMILAITFQVYYTLAVLTRVWSRFRHGDLSNLANVMICLSGRLLDQVGTARDRDRAVLRYEIAPHGSDAARVFDVPFYGFFIKIIDFGHSQIPEEGIVSAVEQNRPERAHEVIADHIAFIAALEQSLKDGVSLGDDAKHPRWEMFEMLNPRAISPFPGREAQVLAPSRAEPFSKKMGARPTIELQHETPSVEEALFGRAFAAFEARRESAQVVRATYRAPS